MKYCNNIYIYIHVFPQKVNIISVFAGEGGGGGGEPVPRTAVKRDILYLTRTVLVNS
jgi:hypothetical protein